MKSMEKYISEVYEKYEETEKANKKYKTVKMKRSNPLVSLCGVAACLIVVGTVFYGMKNYQKPFEDDKPNKYVSSEKKEDGTEIYTNVIQIDTFFDENYLENLIEKSSVIVLVSDFEEEKVNYEYKNGNVNLKTVGKLKINKILKSNYSFNNEVLEFSKSGGILTFSELEKNKEIDWKKWEEEFVGKVITNDKKEHVYYRQVSSKGLEFEKGKKYLVFLKYDDIAQIYNIWDIAYGIMEYDPNTNMVKNIDTGEFEEFDWDLIQENK